MFWWFHFNRLLTKPSYMKITFNATHFWSLLIMTPNEWHLTSQKKNKSFCSLKWFMYASYGKEPCNWESEFTRFPVLTSCDHILNFDLHKKWCIHSIPDVMQLHAKYVSINPSLLEELCLKYFQFDLWWPQVIFDHT